MEDDIEFTEDGKALLPSRLRILGIQAIEYALGISRTDAATFFSKGIKLDNSQLENVRELIRVTKILVSRRDVQSNLLHIDYVNFSSLRYERELTDVTSSHVLNVHREKLVGLPPYNRAGDALLSAFLRLCIDCYPVFLLPQKDEHNYHNYIINLSSLNDQFLELAYKDEQISKILPDKALGDSATGPRFFMSSGCGMQIQPCLLHSHLVIDAYRLMRLRGLHSIDAFLSAASDVLQNLREILEKGEILVPTVLVFEGVSLTEDSEVGTPFGAITAIHEGILDLLPGRARPTIVDDQSSGFVLICRRPCKLVFGETSQEVGPTMKNNNEYISSVCTKLEFAAALIAEGDNPVAIKQRALIDFVPFTSTGVTYTEVGPPHAIQRVLNDLEKTNLKYWCSQLGSADLNMMSIAVKRYVSALTHRRDPIDGFVDGIIALENLFGQRTEIAFSIASSVAKLVESNPEKIEKVFADVKGLYQLRSAVLHGGKELKLQDALDARRKVLLYLQKCFLKLLIDRQDLVDKNSTERAKNLVLN